MIYNLSIFTNPLLLLSNKFTKGHFYYQIIYVSIIMLYSKIKLKSFNCDIQYMIESKRALSTTSLTKLLNIRIFGC